MCGINGIYGFEQLEENPRIILERMNQSIEHRGPDASGVEVMQNVAFGHQRLSIIDLDEASNQPFYSQDHKLYLTLNGEIYNYKELRKELSNQFSFKTNGDTEVLLAAYATWGRECLHKLNGMFAFAIWDASKEELLICRDRLGIKPLYYSFSGNTLLFSSEIRALLSSGLVSKELSSNGLSEYLYYQTVHQDRTIFEHIFQLESGSYLLLKESEFNKEKWWMPSVSLNRKSDQEVRESINRLLKDSVRLRLNSDVSFGAFLSGGIDSSILVGLMTEVSSAKLNTFTVTFEEAEFSEAKYAKEIAKKFGTNHQEIQLTPKSLLNILPDALSAMDHPSGDGPNSFLVSKVTRQQGVKMVLSGLGGDELFAGYPVFKQLERLQERKWLLSFPKAFRNAVGEFLRRTKPSSQSEKLAEVLALDYFDVQHAYPLSRKVLSDSLVSKYLNYSDSSLVLQSSLKKEFEFGAPFAQLPFKSKISWAELTTYLNATLLRDTDQMSMAHALEVRVPFLDHRLVEYCLGVSDRLKQNKLPKQLLLESFPELLPTSIYNRPKMGFTFPWDKWMRGELKEFIDFSIHWLANHPRFREAKVEAFYALFTKNDKRVTWSRIWHLTVLSTYLQRHQLS